MRKIAPLFIFILFILLPIIGFSQATQAINNNLFTKSSSFNLDELKVRWKKAALENCMGVPCSPIFTCGTSTVSDIDGNAYNTVLIGTQCWTKENLKVGKYNDGSNILTGLDNTSWQNTTSGAYAIYDNDSANEAIYGRLYNWYAVNDSRKLCPTGYHVPSDSEWTVLTDYLGGESVAGGKMKMTETTYWNSPNVGATNESGFSAIPGGYHSPCVGCINRSLGEDGYFWSKTEFDFMGGWNIVVNLGVFDSRRSANDKTAGFSVRCLND